MQLTEIRINLCPGPHGPPQAAGLSRCGHSAHGHNTDGTPAPAAGHRLRAFCSLTFDHTFVVRDVKLIEGNDGLFLAMPSRKLCDHCPDCGEKNHLRARYCNGCGRRLDEDRSLRQCQGRNGSHASRGNGGNGGTPAGGPRLKLHADIAHPINAECRRRIGEQVIQAYWREVERSRQPGYVPPSLDGLDADDFEPYDPAAGRNGLAGDSADSKESQAPLVPQRAAYRH